MVVMLLMYEGIRQCRPMLTLSDDAGTVDGHDMLLLC